TCAYQSEDLVMGEFPAWFQWHARAIISQLPYFGIPLMCDNAVIQGGSPRRIASQFLQCDASLHFGEEVQQEGSMVLRPGLQASPYFTSEHCEVTFDDDSPRTPIPANGDTLRIVDRCATARITEIQSRCSIPRASCLCNPRTILPSRG